MARLTPRVPVLALLLVAAACATPGAGSPPASATAPHATDVGLVLVQDGSWRVETPERLPLARVVRVVDGDTLVVEDADGSSLRVRAFGVRAPETDERCGPEATASLGHAIGKEVRLLEDGRTQDRFGRDLRYLVTPDGILVDAALVRMGSARAWRDDGAYRDVLMGLEAEARIEGRGCLWAS